MNIYTSFPQKVFATQIPDVELSSDCSRVYVVMSFANSIIYEQSLYPDSNKHIAMRELSNLVMPFARRSLVATLNVNLVEQTLSVDDLGKENVTDISKASLTTAVIYSTADVSEDAKTFCENHFLSRLLGTKDTAVGRLEFLHYDSAEEASVSAKYDDGSSASFTPQKIGGNNSYSTIDVSPEQYVANGKTLLAYTVTAGGRQQLFNVINPSPDAAPILLFTNSFGCQELVYCTGTHRAASDFKRASTYVNGLLRDYSIDEIRNFDADTGVLTFPMADWITDLFRSDEIYIVNFLNGKPSVGRRIVITAQDTSITNDHDELPRFTFTYRYALRNQNVLQTGRGGRVFDNTFDFTFN